MYYNTFWSILFYQDGRRKPWCVFSLIAVLFYQSSYTIFLLDKDKGDRTTLPEFLDRYKITEELQLEFGSWDNKDLIQAFNDAKEEKERPPMRVVNISVSKTVLGRVENITSSVCSHRFFEHIFLLLPSARILIVNLGLRLPSFTVVATPLTHIFLVHLHQMVPRHGWRMLK